VGDTLPDEDDELQEELRRVGEAPVLQRAKGLAEPGCQ
jgi:hypothetical protein